MTAPVHLERTVTAGAMAQTDDNICRYQAMPTLLLPIQRLFRAKTMTGARHVLMPGNPYPEVLAAARQVDHRLHGDRPRKRRPAHRRRARPVEHQFELSIFVAKDLLTTAGRRQKIIDLSHSPKSSRTLGSVRPSRLGRRGPAHATGCRAGSHLRMRTVCTRRRRFSARCCVREGGRRRGGFLVPSAFSLQPQPPASRQPSSGSRSPSPAHPPLPASKTCTPGSDASRVCQARSASILPTSRRPFSHSVSTVRRENS